jgi:hypothetical protein
VIEPPVAATLLMASNGRFVSNSQSFAPSDADSASSLPSLPTWTSHFFAPVPMSTAATVAPVSPRYAVCSSADAGGFSREGHGLPTRRHATVDRNV